MLVGMACTPLSPISMAFAPANSQFNCHHNCALARSNPFLSHRNPSTMQKKHEEAAKKCCMAKNGDDDGPDDPNFTISNKELDPNPGGRKIREFFDAILEIPDPQLLAGDILSLLIVNFLLQIADEVGDPTFWFNGGFSQPVTMPTTLLAMVVRDSKMSISWILSALWNRSYSTSSVLNPKLAVKKSLDIWVDYFSLRILLEIGLSLLFTHAPVNGLLLAREVWFTAIIMAFFRYAYGKFWSNRF